MKQFMLIFLVLCCLYISGQDFQISFQPSVSGTLIDSIWVTNQKTGQRIKLLASEALILTKSTSAFPDIRTYSKEGFLYPNPNTGSCAVYFSTNNMENVSICIFNASGQLMDHTSRKLKQGYHRF